MSDQGNSIFNNGAVQADKQPTAPQQVVPEYLSNLVGEGKKYGSLEAAYKSIPNAQDHIARLEQENADLRSQTQQAQDLQEVIERNLGQHEQQYSAQQEQPSYDPDNIAALIDDRMNARSAQEKAKANILSADQAMRSKFGDQAHKQLLAKAAELGVGVDFLQQTAQQSPKAFLQLFGLSDKTQPVTPMSVQSSVNTEAMGNYNRPVQPGTRAYYDNLRRTNRSQYYNPKVQAQMSMDMVKPEFNN